MEKQRVYWIDLCKGLGIFLVLVEHTMMNNVSTFIQAFNMPMFFFLSGIVFNEKKHINFGIFFKGRINQLVIPYFFFYLLTWVLWLTVERNFRSFDMQWWEPLLGMIYASQWHGYMDHNGILWFLPCLFIVEVLNFFVLRIKPKYVQYIVVLFLLVLGMIIPINLPWCLNTACVALSFYYLGHLLKEILLTPGQTVLKQEKSVKWHILLLLLFSAVFFSVEGITKKFRINDWKGVWKSSCLFCCCNIRCFDDGFSW